MIMTLQSEILKYLVASLNLSNQVIAVIGTRNNDLKFNRAVGEHKDSRPSQESECGLSKSADHHLRNILMSREDSTRLKLVHVFIFIRLGNGVFTGLF